jgi:hypothetical protein
MTRFDPTLIVTRLVVERNDRTVYDEAFHEGVNVIRGENSSGKSTVLNFIFYGLGGDLADWSAVALLCTRVVVEVRINGNYATLSRDISESAGQPMEIFGGSYSSAQRAPRSEWIRYPYRRSESRESFSQALFRLLGIPEVGNETSGNITIHQMLRLLYADQLSPVEHLFRFERFDPPNLRDTVGRLLCGAYDSKLYENELEIRTLTREFDGLDAELRSLFAVIGKAGQGLTLEWIAGQRRAMHEQRRALQTEIEQAELMVYTSTAQDQLTLRSQEKAYAEVQRLQEALGEARQEEDALTATIADSSAFIASLENKLVALNDSSTVAQYIGEVRFQACPACYAPLEDDEQQAPAHACRLCKTPFDSERTRTRIIALINDTAIQIKQSRLLQAAREERSTGVNARVQALEDEWRQASQRLSTLQRLPSSESRSHLRDLHHQAGYLEREIEDLEERGRLVELVGNLSRRKDELNDRMTRLKSENDRLRASQQERLSRAYTAIADHIRTLLHNDLRREQAFENANRIEFNFSDNRISVDGESYFSASSRVILKSSFFLGFFAAATSVPFFRHPRFVMVDTTEDKGMEPQRSHNFQMQIVGISTDSKVEHQIIYATTMIAPALDDERYTIGAFSTRDSRTIAIRM